MPDGTELRKYSIFEELKDEELEILAPLAKEEMHDAGTRIITEGDTATYLYLVKTGKLQVKMTAASGQDILMDEAGEGMSVGWSALADRRISTASVDVLEPSTLIAFEGEALRTLFDEHCHIAYGLTKGVNKIVCRRLDRCRSRFAAWH